jgi:hypothetical protein
MVTIKKHIAIFCISLLIVVGVVFAITWVYSPPVTVTVGVYSLTLNVDRTNVAQYERVAFSGRLTATGGLPTNNQNITLFRGDIAVAWNLTDSNGNYVIYWNATEQGTFIFQTGFKR